MSRAESPFWRPKTDWIKNPVCNYSEGEWIKYLVRQIPHGVYVASGELVTPQDQHVAAKVIFKHKEICPTGIVVDADDQRLIGALTDTYEHNDHPLRPFRPTVSYNPETIYGSNYYNSLADAGFDESTPTITVLLTLFQELNVPVNPLLPSIIASYWPE